MDSEWGKSSVRCETLGVDAEGGYAVAARNCRQPAELMQRLAEPPRFDICRLLPNGLFAVETIADRRSLTSDRVQQGNNGYEGRSSGRSTTSMGV